MVRRGSIGDDSSNDFSDSGYDNDTSAGTGSTGDDSDNDFGSGGSDVDSGSDTDSSSDTTSDDDDSDYGSGGVTGDDDDDTTYSGGGSSTTTGSGVTGDTDTTETRRLRDDAESDPVNPQTERTEIATDDGVETTDDGGQTTFKGGQSSQNDPYADDGLTGTDDPTETSADTPDRGTSITETPSGQTVAEDGDVVEEGTTSERGVGITRGPGGGTSEVVVPESDDQATTDTQPTSNPDQPFAATTQQQRDARAGGEMRLQAAPDEDQGPRLSQAESRAAVNRYGQRQLDASRPSGESYLDRQIEGAEAATGLEIPGEGDVVQWAERNLIRLDRGQRAGRGFIPSKDEFVSFARRTAPNRGNDIEFQLADATLTNAEASKGLSAGVAKPAGQVANLPGAVLGAGRLAETAGEYVFNTALGSSAEPGTDRLGESVVVPGTGQTVSEVEQDLQTRAIEQTETAAAVGKQTAEDAAESAQERPVETAGSVAFGVAAELLGAGAGVAAGRAIRFGRDRVRTAGGTEVDASNLAGEDVLRYQETSGAEGEEFPPARNPSLYRSDPARAVEAQARLNDPPEVRAQYEGSDAAGDVPLKKALETEPEGSRSGRADRGMSVPDVDSEDSQAYESPGSFTGPELSPNFLRLGSRDRVSLTPGLPDTGGSPTGVVARTDVENPDADTMDEFNEELIEREGETTALTKPSSAVNTREIEAVLPPGAEFTPTGDGGLLRRLGVGSDLYTEIAGRRVPIRTVEPADGGDGGDVDAPSARSQPLGRYSEPVRPTTDRPAPPGSPSLSAALSSGSASGSTPLSASGSGLPMSSSTTSDTSSSFLDPGPSGGRSSPFDTGAPSTTSLSPVGSDLTPSGSSASQSQEMRNTSSPALDPSPSSGLSSSLNSALASSPNPSGTPSSPIDPTPSESGGGQPSSPGSPSGSPTTPVPPSTPTTILPPPTTTGTTTRRNRDNDDPTADDNQDLVAVSEWATKERRDLLNPYTGE